MKSYNAAKDDE